MRYMKQHGEPQDGFRPGERLIDLANAVREDPALPRAAMTALLRRHGESEEELRSLTDAEAGALRHAVVELTERVLAETATDRAAGGAQRAAGTLRGPPAPG